jgi:hypothetical protein
MGNSFLTTEGTTPALAGGARESTKEKVRVEIVAYCSRIQEHPFAPCAVPGAGFTELSPPGTAA